MRNKYACITGFMGKIQDRFAFYGVDRNFEEMVATAATVKGCSGRLLSCQVAKNLFFELPGFPTTLQNFSCCLKNIFLLLAKDNPVVIGYFYKSQGGSL